MSFNHFIVISFITITKTVWELNTLLLAILYTI